MLLMTNSVRVFEGLQIHILLLLLWFLYQVSVKASVGFSHNHCMGITRNVQAKELQRGENRACSDDVYSLVWWLSPLIPACRRLRQENEFSTSLALVWKVEEKGIWLFYVLYEIIAGSVYSRKSFLGGKGSPSLSIKLKKMQDKFSDSHLPSVLLPAPC